MKRTMTILAILLLVSQSFAAFTGLPAAVEKALPEINKYPIASSVLLWADETYELTADGKQVYEWHSFRYIPDEAGRDNWGDPHVAFVKDKETLEILTSRAYTADGRTIDSTPENAFNEITPEELQHAPELTLFRQMVITHLGLENGCIVELHYRKTNNEPLLPWLEGRVELREESPTVSRALHVKIPAGVSLKHAQHAGVPEPEVSGSAYTWSVKNMAGYLPDDLAGQHGLLPSVEFSTADSWQAVKAEIAKRVADASQGNLELPESLKEDLRKATSRLGNAPAIKEWIADRFERYEFHHGDFNAFLRPLRDVFQSGYGNHLELAALVSQLFKQEGLDNGLVLQFAGEPRVPALASLENVIIDPFFKDQAVMFDAIELCADFTRRELIGSSLLSLTGDAKEPKYNGASDHESFEVSMFFDKLDADTISGHGTFMAFGRIAPQELTRREGPVETIESIIDLDGFSCESATCRMLAMDQVMIAFEFTMKAPEKVDDYRVLPLSAVNFNRLAPASPLKLTERGFDQEILPAKLTLTMKGTMPVGWKVFSSPAGSSKKSSWQDSYLMKDVAFHEADGIWEFTRMLDCRASKIPADEWPNYRAWVLESIAQPSNAVVFEVEE